VFRIRAELRRRGRCPLEAAKSEQRLRRVEALEELRECLKVGELADPDRVLRRLRLAVALP
jgi:hypothetical protein